METNQPQDSAEILSDQILRDYRIIMRLGRGGMGDVYLAEQMRVGRRLVALKVLNRACASNPQAIKRFEAEAATAGLIHHRNVVTIYESRMTDDGQIYVAMEYVAGQTLRDILKERRRLPVSEAIEIAKQVCAGLAAAHKLGVVHRDIKPDNIMLLQDDEGLTVKLLDFGIARLSETQQESVHTRPGLILGTPAYMSPEQAAGSIGDQIDLRSDIYSLGVVIYEILTGQVLFAHDSWVEVLHKHLNELPPPPSQKVSKEFIPPGVDEVLMRALAKDRDNRPQSSMEFARELESAYQRAASDHVRSTVKITDARDDYATRADLNPIAVSTDPPRTQTQPNVPVQQTEKLAAPQTVGTSHKAQTKTVMALLALTAILVLGWLVWSKGIVRGPEPNPTPSPIPIVRKDLLEYRVRIDKHGVNLKTLPPDLTVRTGDSIFFEFKLAQPGAVYLFKELSDKSWRWLDASREGLVQISPAGVGPDGRWLVDIPRNRTLEIDDAVNEEKFWLIYVPQDIRWTLKEAIDPSTIELIRAQKYLGTALIDPETVSRLSAQLETDGVRLEAEARQNENYIEYRLSQTGEESRLAYFQITLTHVARK